jgi:hypothetical protein
MAGVHEKVIMEITGHLTREMQDRYDSVQEFEKHDAVAKAVDVDVNRKVVPCPANGRG